MRCSSQPEYSSRSMIGGNNCWPFAAGSLNTRYRPRSFSLEVASGSTPNSIVYEKQFDIWATKNSPQSGCFMLANILQIMDPMRPQSNLFFPQVAPLTSSN